MEMIRRVVCPVRVKVKGMNVGLMLVKIVKENHEVRVQSMVMRK